MVKLGSCIVAYIVAKPLVCDAPVTYSYSDMLVQAKLLQFVSGVFPSSYWLATFAWDLLNASVPVIVSIILFAAFQIESFSGEGLGAVFLLLV